MTSMDPTTADTIDADAIDTDDANDIAREDQDVTDGSGTPDTETGSMGADTAALGGGTIAGETAGADETGGTGDDFQVGD